MTIPDSADDDMRAMAEEASRAEGRTVSVTALAGQLVLAGLMGGRAPDRRGVDLARSLADWLAGRSAGQPTSKPAAAYEEPDRDGYDGYDAELEDAPPVHTPPESERLHKDPLLTPITASVRELAVPRTPAPPVAKVVRAPQERPLMARKDYMAEEEEILAAAQARLVLRRLRDVDGTTLPGRGVYVVASDET